MTTAGEPVTTDVLANDSDPDGSLDPSTVEVESGPSNGTTTVNNDGTITYGPNDGFTGTDSYTYSVADDAGAADTAEVTIQVNEDNQPPTASADEDTTTAGEPVTTDVLANDTDPDGTLDESTVAVQSGPSDGSATANADGTITYTPNSGFTGTDSYIYTVKDDDGAESDTAEVTIEVNEGNQAPTAKADRDTTTLGQSTTTDVLTNDFDEDGSLDPSTVTVQSGPSSGTASANTDGTITYTPSNQFFGEDSYIYTVKDDDGAESDTAQVTIEVNAPPVAEDDEYGTDEDSTLVVNEEEGVLENDSDPEEEGLEASMVVSAPSKGIVTLDADGSFTYTPDPDSNGTDSFEYEAVDPVGAADTATVTIEIDPVNDPPTARADRDTTTEGQSTTTDVLANDTDPDGTLDESTVAVQSGPSDGSATANADGTITYTPNSGFTGTDSYIYTVKDDDGAESDTAEVTIEVKPAGSSTSSTYETGGDSAPETSMLGVPEDDSGPDGGVFGPSAVAVRSDLSGGLVAPKDNGTITPMPADREPGTVLHAYAVAHSEGRGANGATVTAGVGLPLGR
jgi:hypothetical protein